MADALLTQSRLKQYVGGLVDARVRPISLSVSYATGFLQNLVASSQSYSIASQSSATASAASATASAASATSASGYATAAQASLTATQAVYTNFNSVYLGEHASDPTVSSIGHAISANAWYIRTTDGQLRYVSSLDGSGNPTFTNASVPASSTANGLFSISGTGTVAGVGLRNTYQNNHDIRLIQWNDGHFSIYDATSSTELFTITNGVIRAGSGALIWTASNDGAGSGLDADTIHGLSPSAFVLSAGGGITGNITGTNSAVIQADGNILFGTDLGTISGKYLNALLPSDGNQAVSGYQVVGSNQTVQTFTSTSRIFGAAYYNTTNAPIVVSIWGGNVSGGSILTVFLNGNQLGGQSSNYSTATTTFVVPVGWSYSATLDRGALTSWTELR